MTVSTYLTSRRSVVCWPEERDRLAYAYNQRWPEAVCVRISCDRVGVDAVLDREGLV